MGENKIPGLSDIVVNHYEKIREQRREFTATTELRDVLPQLYTDEARAELIHTLACTYVLPDGYVQQAVDFYVSVDNGKAQWLAYMNSGNEQEFVEIGKLLGWKIRKESDKQSTKRNAIQARVAKQARDISLEEYEIVRTEWDVTQLEVDEALYIIDLWEQTNRIEEAANGALNIGIPILAIEIYERHGMYLEDAATVAEQAGLLDRALQDYEANGCHEKAGEVAEKYVSQRRAERQQKNFVSSVVYEALAGAYTPEEKALIERAIVNYEKAGWIEQAVALAERMNDAERVVRIYENAGKAEDAAEYAFKKGMTQKLLEICEKKGEYEGAQGIAKETKQVGRALLYEKIDAIIVYGHNMELYEAQKHLLQEAEDIVTNKNANNNATMGLEWNMEKQKQTKAETSNEEGTINYCKKRVAELRDCIIVEGAYEAIKALCGVDTTGQLVRKAAMPAISLLGFVGSCTTYIAHDELKPEAPQMVYECQMQTPNDIPKIQETKTEALQYETAATQAQKLTRGCGQ